MKKKKIVTVLIFVVIIVLAMLFMVLGAKEEGRKYSIEEVKDYKYYVLQENNLYGVIDKEANIIIKPNFESIVIPNPSKGIFVCTTKNKETKIYNEKNEEKFSEYDEVSSIRLKSIASDLMYEKSVLKYEKDGKYGLIDYSGSKITDPIYGQIEALEYKEGELLVEQKGKFGVINIKGNTLVPIEYETIKVDEYESDDKYSQAGYIVGIKTDEGYRYGYIDVNGNQILNTEYNELSRIIDIKDDNNIYLIASKNGQYGVYKNESQLLNHEYQSIIYNKTNNLFIIEKSKKYGVCEIDGKTIIEIKYAQIDTNGKYIYAKDRNGKTEVFDNTGKLTNMSEDMLMSSVGDGKYTIVVTTNENKTVYGVKDAQEKELIKAQYNYIGYLFDNYFIVSNEDGKLGIIDDKEGEKLPIKYDTIQKVKDTQLVQASITDEQLTEIYSKNIEKLCGLNTPIITEVNGYIKLYNSDENVYISKDGKIVDNTEVYKDNTLFAVKKDGKWGFEDKSNTVKVNCEFEKVTEFNKFGFAGIKKDGKWGVINSDGKIILEPKYEIQTREEPDFLGVYRKVTYGFGEVIYTNM